MRELKFRAWSNDRQTMLQVGDDYGTTHPLDCVVYAKQGQNVILMQYTELKDKNGTEIYEGDISEGEHATYLIKWDKERAQYQAKIIETKSVLTKHCSFPLWQYVEDDGKCRFNVIGNIYANPDLLEGET